MKRKCNLFYTAGEDTNFITFSNYTESLTGSFLATDMKIFPTKFICAYIDGLNDSNRGTFIKDVARYYENKLAFLRDYYIGINKDWQNSIHPLYYLLDFITKYRTSHIDASIDKNGIGQELSYYTTLTPNKNTLTNDPVNNDEILHWNYISYIGEITEQDYNGTYADNICVINSTDTAEYYDFPIAIEEEICEEYNYNLPSTHKYTNTYLNDKYETNEIVYDGCLSYLYSWYGVDTKINEETVENVYEYIGPKNYEKCTPIFDKMSDDGSIGYYKSEPKYTILQKLSNDDIQNKLGTTDINTIKSLYPDNIKFNIIIPLYDLVNINYMSNTNIINENTDDAGNILLNTSETNDKNNFICNIPFGIWFSGNNPIELKRDSATGYAPSWSLVLSTQFKPFPYSNIIHTEITDSAKLDAYQTYAQVLSKQNNLMGDVSKMLGRMNDIEHRIENVEGKFNTVGSSYSLDGLHEELHDIKNYIDDRINTVLADIESITNLLWKYKQ